MADTKQIQDFTIREGKFQELIESYKKGVENGEICSPCPESFAGYIGTTMQALVELTAKATNSESAYYNRAKAYLLLLTWFRAEIAGGQHWPAKSDYMRKFLLMQDWGDGWRYVDKVDSKAAKGAKRYVLSFGDGDKRSKAAWD